MTTPRLDLLAAREARAAERAAAGRPPGFLIIGDVELPLPPELSLDVLNCFGALAAGDPAGLELAIEATLNGGLGVLGEPELDDDGNEVLLDDGTVSRRPTPYERAKVLAGGFTLDDAEWIVDEVTAIYGVDVPKSPGSAPSSPTTSAPSRPTSDASTGSGSAT